MKRFISLVLILTILLSFSISFAANIAPLVYVNGEAINFPDALPFINDDNRVMVPLRFVSEELAADVIWGGALDDNLRDRIYVLKDDQEIELIIGKNYYYLDGQMRIMDTEAILYQSRTYVPLRFVSEALGMNVLWNSAISAAYIGEPPTSEALAIGTSFDQANQPAGFQRMDPTIYSFDWRVYNNGSNQLTYLGYVDNTLMGYFTMDPQVDLGLAISPGDSYESLKQAYPNNLEYILLGNTRHFLNIENVHLVKIGDAYIRFILDQHNDNEVIAVYGIHESEETALGWTEADHTSLRKAYEMESFEITNAFRAMNGLPALQYHNGVAEVAYLHSEDMALKSYFDHENLDGQGPSDRLIDGGISFRAASENIAAGYQNGIFATIGWINSLGHRRNLLWTAVSRIGIGVYDGGDYHLYYTQNFID